MGLGGDVFLFLFVAIDATGNGGESLGLGRTKGVEAVSFLLVDALFDPLRLIKIPLVRGLGLVKGGLVELLHGSG
jgi:hypothetical protein